MDSMPSPSEDALTSFDPAVHAWLMGALRRLRERLGPTLQPHFDSLLSEQRVMREGPHPFFFHPRSLPVAALPVWIGRLARAAGAPLEEARVMAAVEAAAVGYLHVRLQDDLIDEGRGHPGSTMLLAEALMIRHQRLLVEVGPGPGFWDLFEEVWLTYDEAMLFEAALNQADGVADRVAFQRVLGRSLPLLLPPAAVLTAAGMDEALGALTSFVEGAVAAHQLYVDVLDAEKDLENGNRTWIISRFDLDGTVGGLRRRLLVGGGLDEIAAEVGAHLDRCEAAAVSLGMPEGVAFARRRRGLMDALRGGIRVELDAAMARLLSEGVSDPLESG